MPSSRLHEVLVKVSVSIPVRVAVPVPVVERELTHTLIRNPLSNGGVDTYKQQHHRLNYVYLYLCPSCSTNSEHTVTKKEKSE